MRKVTILLLALSLVSATACSGTLPNVEENGTNGSSNAEVDAMDLRLATWNIRILSNGSRDDSELALIATIIDRYNLVAIQEVRDTVVLDQLLSLLGVGRISPPNLSGTSSRNGTRSSTETTWSLFWLRPTSSTTPATIFYGSRMSPISRAIRIGPKRARILGRYR